MNKKIILKIILICLAVTVTVGSTAAIINEKSKGPVIAEYSVSSNIDSDGEDITIETTDIQTTAKTKFSTTKTADYNNIQTKVIDRS